MPSCVICAQVGGSDLWDLHQALMSSREDLHGLEQEVEGLEEELEREQTENQRLQTDVDNFVKRKTHLDRIRKMNVCRPWLVGFIGLITSILFPTIKINFV